MQKFLVIQTAFIGDVVLATALVEKLHAKFPLAQIDFLVRKGNEGLLQNNPCIKNILVWDKKKDKYKNLLRIVSQIRKEQYDKVINVQRFAATGLLTAFSKGKERIGFDKNPFSFLFTQKIVHSVDKGKHEVERNLELIKDFTDDQLCRPKLYPSKQDFDKVGPYKGKPYITISPASVWFTKQFPAAKWISFIKKKPSHIQIYLCGGPGDKQLCDEILQSCGQTNMTNLSGQLSFLQSAALMKDALMNYVNDSAPMHFASAMNAPVTAVFCSTVPAFGFGPMSDIRYIVEVQEPLDCRPCGLHGYKACPKGHFHCAYKIGDEQLLAVLEKGGVDN